ncbi:MAG: amidohydrolase family protein [Anaerolineae bacterium]|nr:amidohydrolase family protein [Anaerolineae bacterium]
MYTIDAHIHFVCDHPDCLALLAELDLKLLNVCVVHRGDEPWRIQAGRYRQLAQTYPDRYAWCTSFDLPDGAADWADHVIAQLGQDFTVDSSAVGCKIWKNVGMEAVKADGSFLMADDPLFDPVYEYLARVGKPLLAHLGEPLACWQPLGPQNPHNGYYSHHPEWHMHGRSEFPSHAAITAARDRVLQKHPALRMIGAHLGSLEYNVDEIARRLDAYPNLAVDTSARTYDLALQDSNKVREFIIAYQDRLLFGTDLVQRDLKWSLDNETRQQTLDRVREVYQTEWAYYGSNEMVTVRGHVVRGLSLPQVVLEKLYHKNAQSWFPGL